MRLASLRHGRDGRLVVVSRDLSRCVPAAAAATLQAALDEWDSIAPRLAEEAARIEAGDHLPGMMPFD
jgi:fumarylacetoacetate (FAA) hydrolase